VECQSALLLGASSKHALRVHQAAASMPTAAVIGNASRRPRCAIAPICPADRTIGSRSRARNARRCRSRVSPSTATIGRSVHRPPQGQGSDHAGKVDHGFDTENAKVLRARLTPLIRKTQPYSKRIAHRGIWVEPDLLAETEYRAKSAEGKVRHPFSRDCARICDGPGRGMAAKSILYCSPLPIGSRGISMTPWRDGIEPGGSALDGLRSPSSNSGADRPSLPMVKC
jgi:hypothetical protein